MKNKKLLRTSLLLGIFILVSMSFNSVQACICSAPNNNAAIGAGTAMTTTGFTANWTNATINCGAITDAQIDISLTNGGASIAGYPTLVGGVMTSKAIGGLACATTYWYRMRSFQACGSFYSAWTGWVSVTTSACGAPSCSDGIKNGTETAIDCGGSCPACPTCSDGVKNGTETGIDCGGSCPACLTIPQTCNPCGAGGASGLVAITPTATGACYTYTTDNTCAFSTAAQYNATCAAKSGGNYYNTQYRTWIKLTVPATGAICMTSVPKAAGTSLPKITLFSNVTCGATNFTAWTLEACAFQNVSNCGGGYTCGPDGTIVATDSYGYGEQMCKTGLTPGSTVYMCLDYLIGADNVGEDICFYDDYRAGSSNWIAGSSTICGGIINGTTLTSIQGQSLCDGYKPASCGGGPGPSFENVSIYKMTSDALGSDMTITITPSSCQQSTLGVQMLIYAAGVTTGCTGTTEVCGAGTCTLGACVGGNTASGMGAKVATITAPAPNTTYYVLVDGFAGSICNFTIGSTGCVVLPITLLDFTVKKELEKVRIEWHTASEENNDYFVLERSADGVDYRAFQVIDGNGTTSDKSSYKTYDDLGGYIGVVYYRLKQVDFNGKITYSVAQSVTIDNVYDQVSVSPNPTANSCVLKFNTKKTDESSEINVYDLNGKLVYSEIHTNSEGLNVVSLDMSNYIKGVYMLSIKNNSGLIQSKIVKQ